MPIHEMVVHVDDDDGDGNDDGNDDDDDDDGDDDDDDEISAYLHTSYKGSAAAVM